MARTGEETENLGMPLVEVAIPRTAVLPRAHDVGASVPEAAKTLEQGAVVNDDTDTDTDTDTARIATLGAPLATPAHETPKEAGRDPPKDTAAVESLPSMMDAGGK